MKPENMKRNVFRDTRDFIRKNYAFLLILAVVIIVIESLSYDAYPHQWRSAGLVETDFQLQDTELKDFRLEDGLLIAESNDPYLTFTPATRVGAISLACSTTSPEVLSQIFFRLPGGVFNEDNNIKFRLLRPVTLVQFPTVMEDVELRLDLTSRAGDVLHCEKFTLNPRPSFTPLIFRIMFYLLVIAAWLLISRFLPHQVKQKLMDGIYHYAMWIFIIVLVLIDLLYTITLTYDSGHYLSLSEVIRLGAWQNWDPIRMIAFPLGIYLSQSIFGFNTTGLLIPMILAHIVLFVVSYSLIVAVFPPRTRSIRLLVMGFIFLFIALDPTVVGYYHTLLTEHPAATVAILACLGAYHLVQAVPFSRRFYVLTLILVLMVPYAWHIKQPYVGAALFPLVIACLLILTRTFTKKNILYVAITGIVTAALVLGSTAVWNGFLRSQGNPLDQNRRLSSFTDKRIEDRTTSLKSDPVGFVKMSIKRYLKSANAVQLDKNTGAMYDFSLTRGYQNEMIAHKMYIHIGALNREPMPKFDPYVFYLEDHYRSPEWLNQLFRVRLPVSNFLFTVTLLLLPFYVIFQLVFWIRRKTPVNALLLILSGSAFLNALLHLMANQIDRYLFWGYPLCLLVLTILLIQLMQGLSAWRMRKTAPSGSEEQ